MTAAYAAEPFVADRWLPLLRSPVHEHRLAALVVMAERARRSTLRRGDPAELQHVYETYLDNTAYVNNWDLVDVSSKPIVGGHLQHRDRAPLYALARSALVWDRRIAMVGSQWFLKAGETDGRVRAGRAAAGRPARPDAQGRRLVAARGRQARSRRPPAASWTPRRSSCRGPPCATPSSTSTEPERQDYLARR